MLFLSLAIQWNHAREARYRETQPAGNRLPFYVTSHVLALQDHLDSEKNDRDIRLPPKDWRGAGQERAEVPYYLQHLADRVLPPPTVSPPTLPPPTLSPPTLPPPILAPPTLPPPILAPPTPPPLAVLTLPPPLLPIANVVTTNPPTAPSSALTTVTAFPLPSLTTSMLPAGNAKYGGAASVAGGHDYALVGWVVFGMLTLVFLGMVAYRYTHTSRATMGNTSTMGVRRGVRMGGSASLDGVGPSPAASPTMASRPGDASDEPGGPGHKDENEDEEKKVMRPKVKVKAMTRPKMGATPTGGSAYVPLRKS
eukprot:GEMP01058897.1.p1 GENE.GEMP01058897.1~~GEMP01058897.1.p1  ORF type:complete len:310 (+),score=59.78 GEMP01058897.1:356-1285(+)